METIKIAHLYYDLMNLYGENGNVKVLATHLENQGVHVTVKKLSIDDKMDFNKYDIFYIGSGTKYAFNLVLKDITKYANDIQNAIDKNKYFIITGNALNLFGKYHFDLNAKEYKCLNVLDFDSEEIDFRIVEEQEYRKKGLKDVIIGVQNRNTILKNVGEEHLFDVNIGTGYYPKCKIEGIQKNHFYGTYLLGPILTRNPHFTQFLVQNIMKDRKLTYKKNNNPFETKAYLEYLKNKNS